jgi:leucyl-tRNA synthetase
LINSGDYNDLESKEAQKQITDKFGQKETTYRLRDWSIGRQRYWGAPIPIVYDPDGEPHAVPKEHLPWELPTDVAFEPTGEPPLAKSNELKQRTEEIFGDGWTPEVDTLDTFVDSSWYFLRFTDPYNSNSFAAADNIADWCPVDTYVGGAEHTVLHLLYARFITKALADLNHVHFREPFLSLRHQGLIMSEDGTKMSKSKGNVVNPNDVVDQVGADTLRLYELFAGPFSETVDWNMDAIAGPRRFLERVWRVAFDAVESSEESLSKASAGDRPLHRTIKQVSEDLAAFKFNTAISSMMELMNNFQEREEVSAESFTTFICLLAPFAPHISEELWQRLGGEGSVHQQSWPVCNEEALQEEVITIAIQVNGKVRGQIEISSELDENEITAKARSEDNVANYLENNPITRHIYVPGRLVNFVTEND